MYLAKTKSTKSTPTVDTTANHAYCPPSQAMVRFVLCSATLFSLAYICDIYERVHLTKLSIFEIGLLAFKTLVEVCASYYGFAFLFIAVAYLFRREGVNELRPAAQSPTVGLIYLCCNDLDRSALFSLANLAYRGKLYLIVHDDSVSANQSREVDEAVEELRRQTNQDVFLLRRPTKEGGKASVINYVLAHTAHLFDYFLLCDNDSTVLDSSAIEKALPYFQDPKIAIVQCRNMGVLDSNTCFVNRLLSRSIDAFNIFLTTYSRFGWQPFVGHNALLRTAAVTEVGGFTPGFFSDDLDLTVRLNLRGYRVAYVPQIQFGEKHPGNHASYRRRSYKWAYGCVQTLRTHCSSVLKSKQLTLAEKFSFLMFSGFYVGQAALLLYLFATFLIAPFFLTGYTVNTGTACFAGSLIILATFLPVLVYFAKDPVRRSSASAVIMCGLVYGTTDFPTARGVWDCLRGRKCQWTPTNVRSDNHPWALLGEALFGLVLLCVPLLTKFPLIYFPCFYLFAGKFLFGPAISVLYEEQPSRLPRAIGPSRVAPFVTAALLVAIPVFLLVHARASTGASLGVQIQGKALYVDGKPFLVKGMHYGPWRPGTGPNKNYPYPAPELIDSDLELIRQLNVNTILMVDPPGYALDLAQKHGLKLLYAFNIDWWALGTSQFAVSRQDIQQRVRDFRQKPALLGWILGNEIPNAAVEQRGEKPIRDGLLDLYSAVQELDNRHFITHSNWPITKDLDLRFFDVTSFNVYPLWPPEVVAHGYGNYIRQVLQPIAGNKPLLITEFGANTIEATEEGQGRLLQTSWQDLQSAGTCGGMVFEFADEWWKNYDNPKRPGDWWDRKPDPDDEKRHDPDPEEYYGIVTGERQPRIAAGTVKKMFATSSSGTTVPAAAVAMLVILAAGGWGVARWHSRPRHKTTRSTF
jgi:cellulose synthase/poly-beta-1,6-N-acetylglucosamine synthase-like glycosyltransferase